MTYVNTLTFRFEVENKQVLFTHEAEDVFLNVHIFIQNICIAFLYYSDSEHNSDISIKIKPLFF